MRKVLVHALSEGWARLNEVNRWCYERRLRDSVDLGVRTVSVGNLQAGGTGKTPLVARIAREALERGIGVCILTRGYRGSWERTGGVIPPVGTPEARTVRTSECGDEAMLLHERAPGAWIGVGRDRVAAFRGVQAAGGRPGLVILDDGFQHLKIRRQVNILAVTSAHNDEVVFRESPERYRDADILVWTKGESEPVVGTPLVKVRYHLPAAGSRQPLWLVTGTGDPEHVLATVRAAGYEVERRLVFRDHARYTLEQALAQLEAAATAGARLALTGKDWVKWRELGVLQEQVLVLEPELVFERGRELWERVLWTGH